MEQAWLCDSFYTRITLPDDHSSMLLIEKGLPSNLSGVSVLRRHCTSIMSTIVQWLIISLKTELDWAYARARLELRCCDTGSHEFFSCIFHFYPQLGGEKTGILAPSHKPLYQLSKSMLANMADSASHATPRRSFRALEMGLE